MPRDELRIRIPSLFGGVSKQPPHLRFDNQLEDAENAVFSVADGASKRAGSQVVVVPLDDEGAVLAGAYRMHAIDRDETEQYLFLYVGGEGVIYHVDGTAQTFARTLAAKNYMDNGYLRLVTVADYTLIVSTAVEVEVETSPDYTLTAEHETYTNMLATTPANQTYHKTLETDLSQAQGFWYYDTGTGTYGTYSSNLDSEFVLVSNYTKDSRNPGGFSVIYETFDITQAGCAFTVANKTITSAGAFDDYTWAAGDHVCISAKVGTGVVLGIYEIASSTDNTLVLKADDRLTGNDTVTVDGIGPGYSINVDMRPATPPDMYAVAQRFQDALRGAGATNALVTWEFDTPTAGAMVITHLVRGSGGTWNTKAFWPPKDTTLYDWATDNAQSPFYYDADAADRSITDGTGSALAADDTLAPEDRWIRKPPPNQEEAVIVNTTMPMQLRRTFGEYEAVIQGDSPISYWRLGEASGTLAVDEMGANDGTYIATPTLGAASLLTSDTADTAVTFNGTNEYVNCGILQGFGNFHGDSVDKLMLEAWVKSSNTTDAMCIMGVDDGAGDMALYVLVNTHDNDVSQNAGHFYFLVRDNAGNETTGRISSNTGVTNGVKHHVMVKYANDDDEFSLWLDGVEVTVTAIAQGTPTNWGNFSEDFCIGCLGGGTPAHYWDGTIDEVSIYNTELHPLNIDRHYKHGAFTVVFDLDTIDWNARPNGSDVTNPAPSIWTNGDAISDMTFHHDRLMFAGGENVVASAAGDYFNVFLDDFEQIKDDDPIDIALSSEQVTIIDFIVPFRQTAALFTKAARQFELNAPELLTADTIAIEPSTSYATQSVQPVQMDTLLYFVGISQDASTIYEYYYDDARVSTVAADVTAHVFNYLPSSIRRLAASTNDRAVFTLPGDTEFLYRYDSFWAGPEKKQSAWGRWTFDSTYDIRDIAVIGSDLFMLVYDGTQIVIEKVSIAKELPDTDWPYVVHLDRLIEATGTFAAGTGYTTWSLGLTDATIDTAVLGPDFTTPGTVITVATVPGDATKVRALGDYTAGEVRLGRSYTMTLELSRPFVRDRNGTAQMGGVLQVRKIIATHQNTGAYTLTRAMTDRADKSVEFEPDDIEEFGIVQAWLNGNSEDAQWLITSDSPKPVAIASVEYHTDFAARAG